MSASVASGRARTARGGASLLILLALASACSRCGAGKTPPVVKYEVAAAERPVPPFQNGWMR